MADRFQDSKVEKDDLILTNDEALNPGTFLTGKWERRAPKHKCLDVTEYQMKVRLDLGETPFQTRLHFFVDVSGN
jgi:hypothetical protein